MRPSSPSAILALAVLVPMLALGCAAPKRLPAVPEADAERAQFPDMPPHIRTWSDQVSDVFLAELTRAMEHRPPEKRSETRGGLPAVDFLAISGGGANGAYAAGLLCGWTEAGNRPTFDLVTGVSTGALASPFAFLGPAYDAQLRRLYTTIRTKDVLEERNVLAGLLGDALANSDPLKRLVRKEIGIDVMAEVAAAYAEGRLLLVTTTNLDAQRGVIWNMGAIAASGHPRALELFQNVLIASASIPAAFPPIMIGVELDGRCHEEMHVDGGTVTQVFVYPPSLRLEATRPRHLYVIRNSRLDPRWKQIERKSLKIAARAVDTLASAQGYGDLYRIFLTAERDNLEFSLAFIPPTFREEPRELFDPGYMSRLFDVAYQQALSGSAWVPYPPGYVPAPTTTKP